MLRFIEDLPSHVVGIHAVGDVTKEDYQNVLEPRLNDLENCQGEINYLLVLDTKVQNFSAGSWFEDLKIGLKHFTKWNKIAIVTDQKGVEWFSDVFRFFIPGKSKGYPLSELNEAIAWISKRDDEGDDSTVFKTNAYTDNDLSEVSDSWSSNKGQGPSGENL